MEITTPQVVQGQLTTGDGLALKTFSWGEPGPRGSILVVHGYAEHSGRYEGLAQKLVEHGFQVHAFDQRGHGGSEGHRVLVPSYQHLVTDLHLVVQHFQRKDAPFFILGHSMGGGVVAHYAAQYQPEIDGVVFSSAALALPDPPGFLLRTISGITSKLMPKGPVPKAFYDLDATAISRIPEEVDRYDQDPLVYRGPILNRTAWSLNCMVEEIDEKMRDIRVPALIIHGEADRLTSMEGSQKLSMQCGSSDVTFKVFPEGYHELFNDLCREEVITELRVWLRERVPV